MQAVFCRAYGGPEVVTIEQAEKPVPKAHEVLVRVHAASVSAADRRIRSHDVPTGFGLPMRLIFGWSHLKKPILGTDLAGVVEAIGEEVTRFKVGDAIVANVGAAFGCHAEFCVLPEAAAIVEKPAELSFSEAVSHVFGGSTALYFLRDLLKLSAGEHILINGAGGAVGSAAVQLAHVMGATVTGVASQSKRDLVMSLGADHFIDYASEAVPGSSGPYDAILDCFGNLRFSASRAGLSEKGRFGMVVAGVPQYLAIPFLNFASGKKIVAGTAPERAADLEYLMQLAASGRLRPVIGASLPLTKAREAHRLLDAEHKTGSIVLTAH